MNPLETTAAGEPLNPAEWARCIRELPSLPSAFIAAVEVLSQDQVPASTCIEAIERDQALTVRVLRLANSAFYGAPGQVSRIGDAVQMLGLRTVASTLAAISLRATLGALHCEGFCFDSYWRHSLCTAHCEGAAHTGHTGGGQHQRVAHTGWRGHHHDDLLHSGHMSGNGIHQHRRRVCGFATRHINAHAVKRRDFLAQQGAVFVAITPALARGLLLCLVVLAHTGRSGLKGIALCSRKAVECRLQFSLGDLQRLHIRRLQTVKTLGVIEHGRIATLLHIGQDVGHALLDGGVGVGRPMQAGREGRFKTGISRVQLQRFGVQCRRFHGGQSFFTAPAKASMMARMGACLSLSAAWFTTKRELMSMMRSTSTK